MLQKTSTSKAKEKTTATEYFCPVCKKPLERYDYFKGNKKNSQNLFSAALTLNQEIIKFISKQYFFSIAKGIGGVKILDIKESKILRIAIDQTEKPHHSD